MGGIVATDENVAFEIHESLICLGISSLIDLDVLIFVYRHRASLVNADQIARFLGYTGKAVENALERLEARGLIRGSRASHGVRLYQSLHSRADAPLNHRLRQLIKSSDAPTML